MRNLFRYKKNDYQGFKDLTKLLETTPHQLRMEKFTRLSLEDPVYMSWVARNIVTVPQILTLSTEELFTLFKNMGHAMRSLAVGFHNTPLEKELVAALPPDLRDQFNEEAKTIFKLKDWSPSAQESAQASVVKTFRSLQEKNVLTSLPWKLPDSGIVRIHRNVLPNGLFTQNYENGQLALEGELRKTQRTGVWHHYYVNGSVMAIGEYKDDLMDGHWVFSYMNGKKKSEGVYEANKKVGLWDYWDAAGEHTQVNQSATENVYAFLEDENHEEGSKDLKKSA